MITTILLLLAYSAPTALGLSFPDGHPVSLLMRWSHLASVGSLTGGLALLLVLAASGDPLLDEGGKKDKAERPWLAGARKLFSRSTLVCILTGLYFAVRDVPSRKGDKVFHSLFGSKMLLALLVFFLSAAVVGRASCLRFVRASRARYLRVALFAAGASALLGVLIRAHKAGGLAL